MVRILSLFFFLLTTSIAGAQLQSPKQFLGYEIGERFTPHWKVVQYFQHVASAVPTTVKLQNYGETYEGRPLIVAFVSSAANIASLETIRTNNLSLARLNGTGTATTDKVITWLSYNVHGNEASSTEAAMMTLYALASGMNNTAQYLQNSVVAIDPCLNPDGRDRYVMWYNSMVGKKYNASPQSREHYEPWPGGRSNHYNFDLNRDWAWQTQKESQQRVALYQQWMPQIHVDFHEQYPDAPYYFAPAAEPYHEVITPFQRQFQTTIGRNHARYFDQQGWLYFTKQYFDLLYPSYGDSYPIFNGSIGMTYEQAGHGFAGLGIQLYPGEDTLTLTDRALHHFTTSISTVEVASKNASSLLKEFGNYFNEAVTKGIGNYKSYVIKYRPSDVQRMEALTNLLRKNGIQFGRGSSGTVRGYNYENGKTESFSITGEDIVIPSLQPRSALVKVLFEPTTALADSFTYDITAWSLPYAYGLQAFATATNLSAGAAPVFVRPVNTATETYGYVVPWNGMNAMKFAGILLEKNIRLRFSETPFSSGGQNFQRGSLIILSAGNRNSANFNNEVKRAADSAGVQIYPVSSGFVDQGYDFGSDKIKTLRKRRVALLTGDGVASTGAGEIWHFFDQQLGYPITLINASTTSPSEWKDFDVVIMPNGRYPFLSDKTGADALKSWVSEGGKIVAIENAVSSLAKLDWTIKSKKAADNNDTSDAYAALRKYENREREFLPDVTPGSIFRVELDNTHPLAYGYPNYYYSLKQDDNIYDFITSGGWNVGVIRKDRQVAGYVGTRLQKKLQDGMLFGVQEIGRGHITYLADNVLFRSFWENGKLMLANAVFLVGQ